MNEKMPIFVKIDEYKEVLDIIEIIKSKILQANSIIHKINDLKNEEAKEIDLWKSSLDDIDGRIQSIDSSLLEPEGL